MSLHNVRLPENIERGASGGPGFNTSIQELLSGVELRTGEWARARLEWDIGYGIQYLEDLEEVINFFYARRGRLFGFRFKDWSDFEVFNALLGSTTGDEETTQFQLVKHYESGGEIYTRNITHPIPETIEVTRGGTSISHTLLANGVISISTTDEVEEVRATFEFDVPVRFSDDHLTMQLRNWQAGQITSIGIIELRV